MLNLIHVLKWVRKFAPLMLIGILLTTSIAFAPAPPQPLDSSSRQLPAENLRGIDSTNHVLQTAVNVLQDPSFEAYTPNPYWTESSTNFGTPLCIRAVCSGWPFSSGDQSSQVWARFGGTAADEASSLSQTIIIPKGAAILQFYIWIRFAAAGSDSADVFTVKIDGTTIFSADATQIESYPVYTSVAVDASTYADGGAHTLAFSSVTTGQLVEFDLDDVYLTSSNSPPQSVAKWSPTDGMGAQTNVLTLAWSATRDAVSFEYCYDVTNDNDCSPWISAGFAYSVKLTRVNVNTIYYWQVRARNAMGVTYADGNTYWSFKVTDLLWSGQTNRGLPVSFQTDADRTRWSDFQIDGHYENASGYYFDLSCDKVPYFPPGAVPIRFDSGAITNDQFYVSYRTGNFNGVFSITGQFTSAATVTGTYTFIGDYGYYFGAHTGYCTYHFNESGTWTAEIPVSHTISGNSGAPGVALSYSDGIAMSALSHGDDSYSQQVSDGWSGTVTPSHPCYTFDPPSRSYSNVTTDLADQSYVATFNPTSGCATVGVSVGGNLLRQYGVQPHISLWADEVVDHGPVKVASADGVTPILASERFLFSYKDSKSNTEMMGYPGDQLTTEYWFPWYNNISYSTQLRVSNMGNVPAEIKVYVGNSGTPIDTFTLLAGQGIRRAYAGLDNGPLQVVSTDGVTPILASERFILTYLNSASYAEMMGYPGDQLATEYWFPWYQNTWQSTQLRVSNLGNNLAEIKVYIGNNTTTPVDTFTLSAGEAIRKAYPGLGNDPGQSNNGPLHVVSTDGVTPILASERFIRTAFNASASYAEMMGYPGDQLTTEYCFPWSSNYTADEVAGHWLTGSELLISNLGNIDAPVKIYLDGFERDSVTIPGGQTVKEFYSGFHNGPLCVQSTDGVTPILTSELLFQSEQNSISYSELMGYPKDRLATSYWFPWYNNLSYSTELRIAKP